MKKKMILCVILIVVCATVCCFALTACNQNDASLRFAAPEGTPALAMLRLVVDNKTIEGKNMNYEVVSPGNIAVEMSSEKADIVIMPINAGANLIRQGANYKLVSVAVDGSLFMVGKKDEAGEITFDDIKGKKIACIGQNAVPGMVFRYVMKQNGINIITEGTPDAENNEVFVKYVADGTAAKALMQATDSTKVDFAVVGEPAATAFRTPLSLNAEMNMQIKYAQASGNETYPQAGLFVKNSLASNTAFMDALFAALQASKDWVTANASEVTAYAKANLYDATFPPSSISRCAINVQKLTDAKKAEIVSFLTIIMPKDSQGNDINWLNVTNLF